MTKTWFLYITFWNFPPIRCDNRDFFFFCAKTERFEKPFISFMSLDEAQKQVGVPVITVSLLAHTKGEGSGGGLFKPDKLRDTAVIERLVCERRR